MLALGRGHTTYTEVPDSPAVVTTPVGRVSLASADAPSFDHAISAPSAAPSAPPPTIFESQGGGLTIPWFVNTGSPAQLAAVASIFAEVQASLQHGELAGSGGGSGDGGDIGRGSEGMALAHNFGDGWFIVPSAANEYGQAYASADGFTWDVAAGEFAADWFFV